MAASLRWGFLAAVVGWGLPALAGGDPNIPFPTRKNHLPSRSEPAVSRPVPPPPSVPTPPPPRPADRGGRSHDGRSHGTVYYGYPYAVPYGYSYGYPYGYDPYGMGGWSPEPYWGTPAPLFIPSELLYGPQALRRFFGTDPIAATGNPYTVEEDRRLAEPPVPKPPRGTSARSVQLATRFIEFGDTHFRAQRYSDALSRYRKATEASPPNASALFRQGFALAALGRYALAADAFRRGLALEPDWPSSNFHLDQLYGRDRVAKEDHLEKLAQQATEHPEDADPLLLLGVYFHCDRQPGRAKPFLQRALQLTDDPATVQAFLK